MQKPKACPGSQTATNNPTTLRPCGQRTHDRLIPSSQSSHSSARRKHSNPSIHPNRHPIPITTRLPGKKRPPPNQPRRPGHLDHRPIRKIPNPSRISPPSPRTRQTISMHTSIDRPRSRLIQRMSPAISSLESLIIAVTALTTRPMASGQSRCLIKEIQLSKTPRRPLHPPTPLELQHTDRPRLGGRVTNHVASRIMQLPPVAPEQTPRRHSNQLATWRDPVASGHSTTEARQSDS